MAVGAAGAASAAGHAAAARYNCSRIDIGGSSSSIGMSISRSLLVLGLGLIAKEVEVRLAPVVVMVVVMTTVARVGFGIIAVARLRGCRGSVVSVVSLALGRHVSVMRRQRLRTLARDRRGIGLSALGFITRDTHGGC